MIILTISEITELHEKLIADGSVDYDDIVMWINTNLK